MKATITGATGLVGSNLALALLDAGHEVTCTRRATSRTDHLQAHPVSWVEAHLGDEHALAAAFDGADVVFHCAAHVAIRNEITRQHLEANVDGTRRVLAAVRRAGVGRLVHCSSVVTTAVSTDGEPVTEDHEWNLPEQGLADAYAHTKRASEGLVLEAAAAGEVDAVVVNPSFMFGPLDAGLSSGRLIVDVAEGRVPGYTAGGGNFADVRDVVRGMIAAWRRGRSGRRYILGGHDLTYKEVFRLVAGVAGARPPRLPIPKTAALFAGRLGDAYEALTGRSAKLNTAMVRYAYCPGRLYSSARARRELGYRISPLEPCLRDAIAWFRAAGLMDR